MMGKIRNSFIGFLLSAISCGVVIYVLESERSLLQVMFSFILLFPLVSFFSAIKGKVAVFFISSVLIMLGYLGYKYEWYDMVHGGILALTLGGAIHLFRVSKVQNFSPLRYRTRTKGKKDKEELR